MSLHFRESAAGESRYAVQSEWASEGKLKVQRRRSDRTECCSSIRTDNV
ncbi:hypothetical protein [Ruminococcus flavefaciens]|nr:hypothetical protein [Ruminococcus flavefaciens]MBQ6168895.1 hypothetical protein [Ruminococcus sp.]